jgi:hypothetical protein
VLNDSLDPYHRGLSERDRRLDGSRQVAVHRPVIFLLVSLGAYGVLTWWIALQVGGAREEYLFTIGHMTMAALLNAHLLYVARRRSLSLIACPPLGFLAMCQIYYTINGIKYFSPILLYPQFDLTLRQQFIGSIGGGVVLGLCSLLLYRQRGPTRAQVQAWLSRYWPDVRRIVIAATAGSILCKVILALLGYGSTYGEAAYTEHAVRNYGDYFVLLANDVFGALSLTFGTIYLCRPRQGHRRPLVFAFALFGVLFQAGYILLYLKARMIVLLTALSFALAADTISRRRAERLLQLLFILLPPASLLGVQLTLLIGRINIPQDTGIRLAIGAVNRRAELTDFATAVQVQGRGTAHDANIITMAVLNAIPRAVFPGKPAVVKDVYSEILEQRLGWPAGSTQEDLLADYLDTSFSNGVMSFGAVGFVLVPVGLVWLYQLLSHWWARRRPDAAWGIGLVSLMLAAMHIEGEWSSIPANFRQAVFIGVLAGGLLIVGRLVRHVLVVATARRVTSTEAAVMEAG